MKPILDGHIIRPFKTRKFNSIEYTVSGSSNDSVFIDEAKSFNVNTLYNVDLTDVNASGISKYLLSSSVEHLFYTSGSTGLSQSPYKLNHTPSSEFYVLNIKQRKYGEKISPGSFLLTDATSSLSYIDDGNGKVYVSGTVYCVGNIFYSLGIVVLDKAEASIVVPSIGGEFFPSIYFSPGYFSPSFYITGSGASGATSSGFGYYPSAYFTTTYYSSYYPTDNISVTTSSLNPLNINGLYLTSGNVLTVQFNAMHTIYEHQVICSIEPGDFNFSTNPTLNLNTISGSYSASTFVEQTGSSGISLMYSGTLTPYFTTLGLFNDVGDMIAVAKFPSPLKRVPTTQQTVIVRLDA